MASTLKWHGDDFRAKIHAEMQRRIKAATMLVLAHWKRSINVEGTAKSAKTVTLKRKDGSKKVVRKGKLLYNLAPSAPGEAPHKQTGRLIGSTAFELDDLIGRVGTNLKYLVFLELGTRHMAARPSLRRALAECRPQIEALLTKPMSF